MGTSGTQALCAPRHRHAGGELLPLPVAITRVGPGGRSPPGERASNDLSSGVTPCANKEPNYSEEWRQLWQGCLIGSAAAAESDEHVQRVCWESASYTHCCASAPRGAIPGQEAPETAGAVLPHSAWCVCVHVHVCTWHVCPRVRMAFQNLSSIPTQAVKSCFLT